VINVQILLLLAFGRMNTQLLKKNLLIFVGLLLISSYCTASNGWSGSKSTSGYESVSPNSDTTYSLTCYGNGGQITRSATIYVTSVGTSLNLTKLGRNLSAGNRVYSKVIRVAENDVIEFYLTITAGSNKDLYNVNIKRYFTFSTKLYAWHY